MMKTNLNKGIRANELIILGLFVIGMVAAILFIGAYQTTSDDTRVIAGTAGVCLVLFMRYIIVNFVEAKEKSAETSTETAKSSAPVPIPISQKVNNTPTASTNTSTNITKDNNVYKKPLFTYWYEDDKTKNE